MLTLKDALCLLAILAIYGIAGQMDYEDAVAAQEVQQSSLRPDSPEECLTAASAVDSKNPPPSKWLHNSFAWQRSRLDGCPPDSGGERARP